MSADIVRSKIEWAEKHVDEAERCLSVFFHDTKPYQLAMKDDTNKSETVLYVKSTKDLPPTLGLTVGDAISNLRSSLDYLACELVATPEYISTQTVFPISETVPTTTDEKRRYDKQVRGMREDVKEIIRKMEPYRGRDNNLWTLHSLNNTNKHRTLVTVAYGTAILSPSGRWETHVAPEEGAELLRIPLSTPDKDQITILPIIVFNEPDADVASHPIMTVLRGCLRDVQRIATVLRPHRRMHFNLSGDE
jgi:hypothetical protein